MDAVDGCTAGLGAMPSGCARGLTNAYADHCPRRAAWPEAIVTEETGVAISTLHQGSLAGGRGFGITVFRRPCCRPRARDRAPTVPPPCRPAVFDPPSSSPMPRAAAMPPAIAARPSCEAFSRSPTMLVLTVCPACWDLRGGAPWLVGCFVVATRAASAFHEKLVQQVAFSPASPLLLSPPCSRLRGQLARPMRRRQGGVGALRTLDHAQLAATGRERFSIVPSFLHWCRHHGPSLRQPSSSEALCAADPRAVEIISSAPARAQTPLPLRQMPPTKS
jgi:hypothetical protein